MGDKDHSVLFSFHFYFQLFTFYFSLFTTDYFTEQEKQQNVQASLQTTVAC